LLLFALVIGQWRWLTLDDRKSVEGMTGEGFRDVGILILVFALLDKVIAGSITGWWTLTAIAISGAFFSAGCYLERRRPIG
jgi:hypothetical protein